MINSGKKTVGEGMAKIHTHFLDLGIDMWLSHKAETYCSDCE